LLLQSDYCIGIQNGTDTAQARRAAVQLATGLSFDETEAGNVGLVVTEAATNLLKHGGGGDLLIREVQRGASPGIEILAIDRGPGIPNITRSFEDGYSTAGTPGNGLGAISRLSSMHDVYSRPAQGTVLMSQIWKRRNGSRGHHSQESRFRIGAVSVPKTGESVCGDAWGFVEQPVGGGRLMVADGLGHGLLAADASRAAVRVSKEHPTESGILLMQRLHSALRPTRGAAVALAEIDLEQSILRYTGIGNIGASIIARSGAVQRPVSQPGTAGHEVPRLGTFQYSWDSWNILVMYSDGLISHWSLNQYPGLLEKHPSVIAAVLYRDFNRGRDDVTVVVLQEAGSDA